MENNFKIKFVNTKTDPELHKDQFQELKARIRNHEKQELKKRLKYWKITSIAATILFIFGLTVLYQHYSTNYTDKTYSIAVHNDYIVLPDSTKIWLGKNSTIKYNEYYLSKKREVVLSGEAYFEVTHNKEKPFYVITDKQTVKVLGTSFNISAYENSPNIKTVLVEGSINVSVEDKSLLMSKGNSLEYEKESGKITLKDVDLKLFMAWKTHEFIFNDMKLEDIMKVLEKGFKVNIEIKNPDLKVKPYTMKFVNEESLEKILDLIQVNAKYKYKYQNGTILIY